MHNVNLGSTLFQNIINYSLDYTESYPSLLIFTSMQTTDIIFKQYTVKKWVKLARNLLKFQWKIITIMNVEHDSVIGMATHCNWTVQGSNPVGGEILHTCPDLPWGPSIFLFNWYWVSFLELKQPGQDIDHPFPSNTEIIERAQLYLHSHFRVNFTFLWTSYILYLFHFVLLLYSIALERHFETTSWNMLLCTSILSTQCQWVHFAVQSDSSNKCMNMNDTH
jgi:hypothetical protein